MLTPTQLGWQILIPMIGAFVCALVAHKRADDSNTSPDYKRRFFNQSFLRNFFLNANFALFITLMQMYQGHDLDLVVTLFTFAMIGISWIISSNMADVPHNVADNRQVKPYVVGGWILIAALILFTAVSPRWLQPAGSSSTPSNVNGETKNK